MQTFTFGTTPEKVIEASLPHKYNMELNKSDMLKLLKVLYSIEEGPRELTDWAFDFRTSILSTIGIEEI